MKILVAPLDWGLGHATRCVPVIQEFLRQGAEVDLAVVEQNASLLRGFFPQLKQFNAPSYGIVYPKHGSNMGLWLLKNAAHLCSVMKAEQCFAEEMVQKNHYDVLFSDNRFAFYSENAYSIYMTHQRRIAFPEGFSKLEGVGEAWHNSRIKHFDEVWVPDLEEEPGYAGAMSHVKKTPVPVKFVGPLSRFSADDNAAGTSKKYGVVAVISGVEPARSQFEAKLREILPQIPGQHVMILGKPSAGEKTWCEGNVEFHHHLPTETFAEVVRNAEWVISRGGYSTIMDMAVLGAKCIVVPTPGQYEQIVLGKSLDQSGYGVCIPANQLTAGALQAAFSRQVKLPVPPNNSLLKDAVASVKGRV